VSPLGSEVVVIGADVTPFVSAWARIQVEVRWLGPGAAANTTLDSVCSVVMLGERMNVRAKDASLRARWEVSTDAPPRLRIEPLPRPRLVSGWLYGFWLVTSVAVWATLFFVLPSIDTMLSETGIPLSAAMEMVIGLSRVARSPLGVVACLLALAGSVQAFRRLGDRKALRRCFQALTLFGILFFPFAFLVLLATLNTRCCPL
jgi:hypothetical protein